MWVGDVTEAFRGPIPIDQLVATPTNQVLFPGKPSSWGTEMVPVAENQLLAVRSGSHRLVIFGRLRYRDAFGDTHHTDFSFVWIRFKEGRSTNDDFIIHPHGYTDAD